MTPITGIAACCARAASGHAAAAPLHFRLLGSQFQPLIVCNAMLPKLSIAFNQKLLREIRFGFEHS
jgi:hypothetical protein